MARLLVGALVLALAAPASAASVVLTWTDNSPNETGFDVERKAEACTASVLPFAKVGAVAANVTTYTDPTVTEGSTYCYRADAFNTTGKSAYSNTATVTVPFTIPAAPSGLGAVAGP